MTKDGKNVIKVVSNGICGREGVKMDRGWLKNQFGFGALIVCLMFFLTVNCAGFCFAGEEYELVLKWGNEGSGQGQFLYPADVAVDSSGNVYVADSENYRIQKFDSEGNFLSSWGEEGIEDGQFAYPSGVSAGVSGNIYVTDIINPTIQKFNSDGEFISKWGSAGEGNGQFADTGGVAVDSSGDVYVVDIGNSRIQKFDSDGDFLLSWGVAGEDDGQFLNPEGVAVDSSGDVYVADSGNSRVQKFNSEGEFISSWGSEGEGDSSFSYPCGIAVDMTGNVYVADNENHRIQKFSLKSDGENPDNETICPAIILLGKQNPSLSVLRKFRDEVLSKSETGRKVVSLYYGNAEEVNALLDRNPVAKEAAEKMLKSLLPAIELFLKTNR